MPRQSVITRIDQFFALTGGHSDAATIRRALICCFAPATGKLKILAKIDYAVCTLSYVRINLEKTVNRRFKVDATGKKDEPKGGWIEPAQRQ